MLWLARYMGTGLGLATVPLPKRRVTGNVGSNTVAGQSSGIGQRLRDAVWQRPWA